MLILSEYPNNKKTFYTIMNITDFLANYKHVGLCTTHNKDKSASSTVFRKKDKLQWRQKKEKASPAAVSYDRDSNDVLITCASGTSRSSVINGI